ncbi:glycosyltransferase [Thiorhodococcus mannitoliphagus]|uniref:Glycosyltransferase n=1 Tax=Thiorhodococcus mannitoliphagus TaxID=329406 RepID=A0A6P1DMT6_9GAMM|nr:PIG-L family deacetylase [Thiorhodococcus mannitoliphagus]NEX19239.1 glycosyltransferase [Thiorhodococcus mannitoliphagus]
MPGVSALILAPHPDDEVLGCGGAIMRHVAANDPIQVAIVTDGAFGSAQDRAHQTRTRQHESRCAAKVLGYDNLEFWELPDRGLAYGEPLIRRILAAIEAQRAELVYAPSWWEMHPDHFVLALATAEAIRRCSRPLRLMMYEIGVPLHPNRLLDITDLVERKEAAIACFASQLAQQRYDEHILALNAYRTYTLPSKVRAAEAYRILDQDELRRDPIRAIRPGIYYTQNGSREAATPPLVSIIVADSKDGHPTDTLDSIAIQTYSNIEILMPPGEPPIWDKRFPVRQLGTQDQPTPAQWLNQALDAANGDFIAILTDDSVLEPDHISVMVEALAASGCTGCGYSSVHEASGAPTDNLPQPSPGQLIERFELWGGAQVSLSRFLIARKLIEGQCRFDESLDHGYEWDFLVQLSRRTACLPVAHSSVRVRRQAQATAQSNSLDAPFVDPSLDAAFAKWQATWSPSEMRALVAWQGSRRIAAEQSAQRQAVVLEEQTAALRNAQSDAEALRQRLAEAHARLQQCTRELESAHQEVHALRQSTSWRLTAPLRLLMTRLKGAKP